MLIPFDLELANLAWKKKHVFRSTCSHPRNSRAQRAKFCFFSTERMLASFEIELTKYTVNMK